MPASRKELSEVSSRVYPTLERVPGKQNWVDKTGGLPSYIERIAKHMHYERGRPIGVAIASAVETVRRWCSTGKNWNGGDMKATTRAKACKAVASWEAKKAKSKAKTAAKKLKESAEMTEARELIEAKGALPCDDEVAKELARLTTKRLTVAEGMLPALKEPKTVGKQGLVKAAIELLEADLHEPVRLGMIGGPAAEPRDMKQVADLLAEEVEELRALAESLGGKPWEKPYSKKKGNGKGKKLSKNQKAAAKRKAKKAGRKYPNLVDNMAASQMQEGKGMWIKDGDSGEPVKEVQQQVEAMGRYIGDAGADGKFGYQTKQGVKAVQRREGLKADGIVGPVTKAMMDDKVPPDQLGAEDGAAPEKPSVEVPSWESAGSGLSRLRKSKDVEEASVYDPDRNNMPVGGRTEPAKFTKKDAGWSGRDARDPEFEQKHPRNRIGRWINKGAKGPAVAGIQKDLGMQKASGKFDDRTEQAVRRFQEQNNLQVDGIVGSQTAAAMMDSQAPVGQLTDEQRKFLTGRGKRAAGRPLGMREAKIDKGAIASWLDSLAATAMQGDAAGLAEMFDGNTWPEAWDADIDEMLYEGEDDKLEIMRDVVAAVREAGDRPLDEAFFRMVLGDKDDDLGEMEEADLAGSGAAEAATDGNATPPPPGPPNLRESRGGDMRCDTCVSFKDGECVAHGSAPVGPDMVCDDWKSEVADMDLAQEAVQHARLAEGMAVKVKVEVEKGDHDNDEDEYKQHGKEDCGCDKGDHAYCPNCGMTYGEDKCNCGHSWDGDEKYCPECGAGNKPIIAVLSSEPPELAEAVLTAKARKELPESDFALPGRKYPIHTEAHARAALSRSQQFATPEERKKIKAKVKARYPDMELQEATIDNRIRGAIASGLRSGWSEARKRAIKRLSDGTFAPKGRGKVLYPGDSVDLGGTRGKVDLDGASITLGNGRKLKLNPEARAPKGPPKTMMTPSAGEGREKIVQFVKNNMQQVEEMTDDNDLPLDSETVAGLIKKMAKGYDGNFDPKENRAYIRLGKGRHMEVDLSGMRVIERNDGRDQVVERQDWTRKYPDPNNAGLGRYMATPSANVAEPAEYTPAERDFIRGALLNTSDRKIDLNGVSPLGDVPENSPLGKRKAARMALYEKLDGEGPVELTDSERGTIRNAILDDAKIKQMGGPSGERSAADERAADSKARERAGLAERWLMEPPADYEVFDPATTKLNPGDRIMRPGQSPRRGMEFVGMSPSGRFRFINAHAAGSGRGLRAENRTQTLSAASPVLKARPVLQRKGKTEMATPSSDPDDYIPQRTTVVDGERVPSRAKGYQERLKELQDEGMSLDDAIDVADAEDWEDGPITGSRAWTDQRRPIRMRSEGMQTPSEAVPRSEGLRRALKGDNDREPITIPEKWNTAWGELNSPEQEALLASAEEFGDWPGEKIDEAKNLAHNLQRDRAAGEEIARTGVVDDLLSKEGNQNLIDQLDGLIAEYPEGLTYSDLNNALGYPDTVVREAALHYVAYKGGLDLRQYGSYSKTNWPEGPRREVAAELPANPMENTYRPYVNAEMNEDEAEFVAEKLGLEDIWDLDEMMSNKEKRSILSKVGRSKKGKPIAEKLERVMDGRLTKEEMAALVGQPDASGVNRRTTPPGNDVGEEILRGPERDRYKDFVDGYNPGYLTDIDPEVLTRWADSLETTGNTELAEKLRRNAEGNTNLPRSFGMNSARNIPGTELNAKTQELLDEGIGTKKKFNQEQVQILLSDIRDDLGFLGADADDLSDLSEYVIPYMAERGLLTKGALKYYGREDLGTKSGEMQTPSTPRDDLDIGARVLVDIPSDSMPSGVRSQTGTIVDSAFPTPTEREFEIELPDGKRVFVPDNEVRPYRGAMQTPSAEDPNVTNELQRLRVGDSTTFAGDNIRVERLDDGFTVSAKENSWDDTYENIEGTGLDDSKASELVTELQRPIGAETNARGYAERVAELEAEGMTTSDAQGIADGENWPDDPIAQSMRTPSAPRGEVGERVRVKGEENEPTMTIARMEGDDAILNYGGTEVRREALDDLELADEGMATPSATTPVAEMDRADIINELLSNGRGGTRRLYSRIPEEALRERLYQRRQSEAAGAFIRSRNGTMFTDSAAIVAKPNGSIANDVARMTNEELLFHRARFNGSEGGTWHAVITSNLNNEAERRLTLSPDSMQALSQREIDSYELPDIAEGDQVQAVVDGRVYDATVVTSPDDNGLVDLQLTDNGAIASVRQDLIKPAGMATEAAPVEITPDDLTEQLRDPDPAIGDSVDLRSEYGPAGAGRWSAVIAYGDQRFLVQGDEGSAPATLDRLTGGTSELDDTSINAVSFTPVQTADSSASMLTNSARLASVPNVTRRDDDRELARPLLPGELLAVEDGQLDGQPVNAPRALTMMSPSRLALSERESVVRGGGEVVYPGGTRVAPDGDEVVITHGQARGAVTAEGLALEDQADVSTRIADALDAYDRGGLGDRAESQGLLSRILDGDIDDITDLTGTSPELLRGSGEMATRSSVPLAMRERWAETDFRRLGLPDNYQFNLPGVNTRAPGEFDPMTRDPNITGAVDQLPDGTLFADRKGFTYVLIGSTDGTWYQAKPVDAEGNIIDNDPHPSAGSKKSHKPDERYFHSTYAPFGLGGVHPDFADEQDITADSAIPDAEMATPSADDIYFSPVRSDKGNIRNVEAMGPEKFDNVYAQQEAYGPALDPEGWAALNAERERRQSLDPVDAKYIPPDGGAPEQADPEPDPESEPGPIEQLSALTAYQPPEPQAEPEPEPVAPTPAATASPGRSAKGNLRRYSQMLDGKLLGLIDEMQQDSGNGQPWAAVDPDAWAGISKAAEDRGIDLPEIGAVGDADMPDSEQGVYNAIKDAVDSEPDMDTVDSVEANLRSARYPDIVHKADRNGLGLQDEQVQKLITDYTDGAAPLMDTLAALDEADWDVRSLEAIPTPELGAMYRDAENENYHSMNAAIGGELDRRGESYPYRVEYDPGAVAALVELIATGDQAAERRAVKRLSWATQGDKDDNWELQLDFSLTDNDRLEEILPIVENLGEYEVVDAIDKQLSKPPTPAPTPDAPTPEPDAPEPNPEMEKLGQVAELLDSADSPEQVSQKLDQLQELGLNRDSILAENPETIAAVLNAANLPTAAMNTPSMESIETMSRDDLIQRLGLSPDTELSLEELQQRLREKMAG